MTIPDDVRMLAAVIVDTVDPKYYLFGQMRQQMIDAIARAIMAEREAKWQPIETAPKDWSDLWLYDPDYEDVLDKTFEGYFDVDTGMWRHARGVSVTPTHWMHLPTPPSGKE